MNLDAKLDLSILPNPCKSEAIVKFSSDFPGSATLKIVGLNGQTIKECYKVQADAGVEYFIPVSVNSLNNGIYFCQLNIGNQTRTTKLIVVK